MSKVIVCTRVIMMMIMTVVTVAMAVRKEVVGFYEPKVVEDMIILLLKC